MIQEVFIELSKCDLGHNVHGVAWTDEGVVWCPDCLAMLKTRRARIKTAFEYWRSGITIPWKRLIAA